LLRKIEDPQGREKNAMSVTGGETRWAELPLVAARNKKEGGDTRRSEGKGGRKEQTGGGRARGRAVKVKYKDSPRSSLGLLKRIPRRPEARSLKKKKKNSIPRGN